MNSPARPCISCGQLLPLTPSPPWLCARGLTCMGSHLFHCPLPSRCFRPEGSIGREKEGAQVVILPAPSLQALWSPTTSPRRHSQLQPHRCSPHFFRLTTAPCQRKGYEPELSVSTSAPFLSSASWVSTCQGLFTMFLHSPQGCVRRERALWTYRLERKPTWGPHTLSRVGMQLG